MYCLHKVAYVEAVFALKCKYRPQISQEFYNQEMSIKVSSKQKGNHDEIH